MSNVVQLCREDTTKVEIMRWRQAAARYRSLYHEEIREKWILIAGSFAIGLAVGMTGTVAWML